MRLWTIEPVASAEDPRWQERTIWRRVVVRAESAAAALRAARCAFTLVSQLSSAVPELSPVGAPDGGATPSWPFSGQSQHRKAVDRPRSSR